MHRKIEYEYIKLLDSGRKIAHDKCMINVT